MTRLNVDQGTSLKSLQDFAAQAGANAKIRGQRNPDGSITLYSSDKKGSGVGNFIKGNRADKRSAARDAINTVLDNVKRMPGTNAGATETALTPVRAQIGNAGELLGSALVNIGTAADVVKQANVPLSTRAHEAVTTGDATKIKTLGAEYGARLAANVTTQNAQLNLMERPSGDVKDNILRNFANAVGGGGAPFNTTYANAPKDVKRLADESYNAMMSQLPDRMVNDTTLRLGGRDFTVGVKLGSGGYADAFLCTANDGSGDQVVVKMPKNPSSGNHAKDIEARDAAGKELQAHRAALPVGQNHAHMVGLKGAVAGPNGSLALVLEVVPRGDGNDLKEKVNDLVTRGVITADQAKAVRLTFLKDMLSGLERAQSQNIVHLDLKPVNYFIDSTGRAKMGDFGTAAQGAVRTIYEAPDNPGWQSPEILAGRTAVSAITTPIVNAHRAHTTTTRNDLKTALPKETYDAMVSRMNARHEANLAAAQNANSFQVTTATDTWSIGASAHELFFGKTPFDLGTGFINDDEQATIAFGQNPNNRIRTAQNAGRPLDAVDNLINEMMHPVAGQRPTATQLLGRPVLNGANVGSQAVRDLILAITDGNATDASIQLAAAAV